MQLQDEKLLRDMCDGSVYKEHPIFSQNHSALQIIAIELCNPLGSHTKVHKLGCIFFTLGNIPAKFRSQLKSIFLVTLASAPTIHTHGIDEILKPFVEELKTLSSERLSVSIDGESTKYEVALLAFLADNLGAHQIGGFKESMSFAYRICCSCMSTTEDAQNKFVESKFELRTPDLHIKQCDDLKSNAIEFSKQYGINRTSILETIPNFSVVQNLPHDIMHDILEGVIPHEMKALLFHFIKICKYFTLNQLNERLSNYNYGYSEVSDKPTPISDIDRLRQSAAQMWLLANLFPFLIGDLIPEDSEHWHCFLLLLRICSIAAAWTISSSTIEYLAILIEEHHLLFKKLYPDVTIIPKMHYMVHYPSQIRKFGPLIYSWTMRYESKLRVLKRASRHGNFKNICKTVAKKHQHLLCYYLNNDKLFLQKEVEEGPAESMVTLASDTEFYDFIREKIFVNMDEVVKHPKFINYEVLHLRRGGCIFMGIGSLYPMFAKVIDLISWQSSYYLKIQNCNTICFDSHYNSFMVSFSSSYCYVPVHSLPMYPVIHIRKLCTTSDSCFLTLKQFVQV